jgi:hypothetical protein
VYVAKHGARRKMMYVGRVPERLQPPQAGLNAAYITAESRRPVFDELGNLRMINQSFAVNGNLRCFLFSRNMILVEMLAPLMSSDHGANTG